jgi:hypothetical protein
MKTAGLTNKKALYLRREPGRATAVRACVITTLTRDIADAGQHIRSTSGVLRGPTTGMHSTHLYKN